MRVPTLILAMFGLMALTGADGTADSAIRHAQAPLQTIDVDGRTRSYRVRLPAAYDAGRRWPLLVALHGGGGSADGMPRMTGLDDKADDAGFIVVYPNGTGPFARRLLTWNAGNCCGRALDEKVDDVRFLRLLIDRLRRDVAVDPARIYLTGISNGAKMAHRAACELSDVIAAIAPVAGSLDVPCTPQHPVAVIMFHGLEDRHVRYEGGAPLKQVDPRPRVDNPMSHAVATWRTANGCSEGPLQERRGTAHIERWTHCRDGADVVVYAIEGEGHTWPGGRRYLPNADPPSREVNATDLMWSFFAAHPKLR